jgi:DNA-binding transcriptional MerR regulator
MSHSEATLIPIGRFAQLAGFTVRALRHYESQGLLEPARVDPDSGYRFYRPEQLGDALRVRLLRGLDMSLADVVQVMRAPDAEPALELLRAHRARVAERLVDFERLLARLDEWLEGTPAEDFRSLPPFDEDAANAATDVHASERVRRTFLELFGPGEF